MDLVLRVERACREDVGDRLLRSAVLSAIARAVPFDAHVFALTDPVTRVASSPHATVPAALMCRLPELIRRRYVATPDSWRGWLAEQGISDVAFTPFSDRYGAWGWLELWRSERVFTAGERAMLDALRPAVTSGLRRTAARTFGLADELLDPVGPGVVLLDADLSLRSATDAAAAALLRLLPPDEPAPPVPAAAYNVGAALLAGEAGHPWQPTARVHLGGNRWVSLRAARLGSGIAVSIGPATAAERSDLVARAHGLSPRETEVLGLAVHGLDSRAIAARLVIAPTTAEDHLKALLAKTGAPSRQVLVARALGA